MGAKDSQLKSYLGFYHSHGYDTLSFAVGPRHVLFPTEAFKFMENVLKTALEVSNEYKKSDDVSAPIDIVFHSFSMGGYLFGQSLRCIKNNQESLGAIPNRIKAQIFDSPPDRNSIPFGISRSVGSSGPVVKMVENLATLYLKVTENSSGVEH